MQNSIASPQKAGDGVHRVSIYFSHECVGCRLYRTGGARAGGKPLGKDGRDAGGGSGEQEGESGMEEGRKGGEEERKSRGGRRLKQEKGKTVTVSSPHAS